MFSGLVQALGRVYLNEGSRFGFEWPDLAGSFVLGESIAVNGCCLTVVDFEDNVFYADLVDETLARTTMTIQERGDEVNLERSMAVGDSIGGHFVLGHVDGVGVVERASPNLRIVFDSRFASLVVEKGSIAIDGVSLTVVTALDDVIEVAIIPHTSEVTTLGSKVPGDKVNLEFDVLAKHVTRLMNAHLARLDRPGSNTSESSVTEIHGNNLLNI